ncbi:MAG: hypothetical protein JSS79_05305 [Bacteroidetes bacterium]|nr:hypothetical protein [Bacteroidota bacterium]
MFDFGSSFEDLVRKVWETQGVRFDKQILDLTLDAITKAFDNGFGQPSFDLNSPDYLRLSLNESNIARFAAAKTVSQVLELNRLKNKFEKFPDFQKAVQQTNITYNKTWLKAEYDTAYTTGQTSADYWRQIESKELFPYVMFDTMGDGRVRDSHAALDGKVARVGSTLHDFFNPPLGYNCRCRLKRLSDDEATKVSTVTEVKSILRNSKVGNAKDNALDIVDKYGFGINRAKTNEVFTDSQFFVKNFKESGLRPKDYGLKSYDQLKQHLPSYHDSHVDKEQFFKQHFGSNNLSSPDAVRLKDYRNRPIIFPKGLDFKDPFELQNALSHPSEVWLVRDGETYRRQYLKFYKNKAVRVEVNLNNGLDETIVKAKFENAIDGYRKGVKIE